MAVIFDVDGTLLDTYQVVKETYIAVFKKYLPSLKYDEDLLKSFFGPPLRDTFYYLTNDYEFSKQLVEYYCQQQKVISPNLLKPFPGVIDLISKLHENKIKMGILSNKSREAIIDGFTFVGLPNYFAKIIGVYDTPYPKPLPQGLLDFKDFFKEELVMVGDSAIDILTARNAEVNSIGVTWGISSRQALEDMQATIVVNNINELAQAILNFHK